MLFSKFFILLGVFAVSFIVGLSNQSAHLKESMTTMNTVIVKDVISRNKIKDISLLEQIVKYVISNTGNIISANKISGYISNQNKLIKCIDKLL